MYGYTYFCVAVFLFSKVRYKHIIFICLYVTFCYDTLSIKPRSNMLHGHKKCPIFRCRRTIIHRSFLCKNCRLYTMPQREKLCVCVLWQVNAAWWCDTTETRWKDTPLVRPDALLQLAGFVQEKRSLILLICYDTILCRCITVLVCSHINPRDR